MTVFIIKNLDKGCIEPSSSRREGVWKSRATALQRIKSHWHVKWDWDASYADKRPWLVKKKERDDANFRWCQENPFEDVRRDLERELN